MMRATASFLSSGCELSGRGAGALGGRLRRALISTLFCLSMTLCGPAAAESNAARPKGATANPLADAPLPPSRPDGFGAPKPPSAATVSQPRAPVPPPASPPPPGYRPLPAAPREVMRACAVEWQKIKLDGQARDRSWRDFAEICLRR